MEAVTTKQEAPGIVYRTVCQNPGCAHTFDLRITAKEVGLLSGTMPCPRCKRRGGMLKPAGRLGEKLLAAKLIFRMTGVTHGVGVPNEEGDLLSDISG